MSEKVLHPSVQQFKKFVDANPNVKSQIRKNHNLIQSYYEKWMILGEEDSFWKSLSKAKSQTNSNKKDWMKQFGELMQDVNWEDVSKHIDDLDGAIGQILQLISNMQREKEKKTRQETIGYPYY
ncbi:YlbD family protein [Halobacillus shinanisalinarum]|uniref:YlbD family protein n=1 Tax=Halobacillus shinanisalinarum TaxID=2932258 RepID=A0ABY4GYR7_9BACI|nr:YlbD family protein [Halobacillus shinanisalinarum]UOQ93060.1 YlbD family protein [Halobacillus shinanisalinarum]